MTQTMAFHLERRVLNPVDPQTFSLGMKRLEKTVIRDLDEHDEPWSQRDSSVWQTWYSLKEHSVQVARLMAIVAQERGRSERGIDMSRIAGLLHDVGKIRKKCEAYRLNSVLNPEENALVALHAGYSAHYIVRMLSAVRAEDHAFLRQVLRIVRHHHTPWRVVQGGLRDIAWDVKVVDAFVSLQENRWRPGLSQQLAIEVLPEVVMKEIPLSYRMLLRKEIRESLDTVIHLFSI
jgi:hypothetical protein